MLQYRLRTIGSIGTFIPRRLAQMPLLKAFRIARCLLKSATLVAFITLVLVVLIHIKASFTNQERNYKVRIDAGRWKTRTEHKLYNRTGKVVLLYSHQRSGSTFVGEFFNKNPDTFYLFEPLFSFGLKCSTLYEERLNTLVQMARCDFREVPSAYRRAKKVSPYDDSAGKCITNNICFYENQRSIMENYHPLNARVMSGNIILKPDEEVNFDLKNVGKHNNFHRMYFAPLDTTVISALCSASNLVAYKILRVCHLSRLESVYQKLTEMGIEVFIIHLVRDPRAIINSIFHVRGNSNVAKRAQDLCNRIVDNLNFADQQTRANTSQVGMISDGRYLRVRHEDISEETLEAAEQIYRFIGMELPEEVSQWLQDSTIDPEGRMKSYENILNTRNLTKEERRKIIVRVNELRTALKSAYGTVRDSKSVPYKWRQSLNMATVEVIQKHCSEAMERLGYKLVHSVKELENFDITLG